jgi:hypothetical protein
MPNIENPFLGQNHKNHSKTPFKHQNIKTHHGFPNSKTPLTCQNFETRMSPIEVIQDFQQFRLRGVWCVNNFCGPHHHSSCMIYTCSSFLLFLFFFQFFKFQTTRKDWPNYIEI